MIKLLLLVFDLLEISIDDSIREVGGFLEKNPSIRVHSFCDKGFVLVEFQKLLLGKISQDEFVSLGDSFGFLQDKQINPAFDFGALVYGMKHDIRNFENSVVLIPKSWKFETDGYLNTLNHIYKKHKIQIFYL